MYGAIGFILGLLFGSFLNVCITRLPRQESVVHPRSRCPQCGAAIRWYDNIPLLSCVVLRGGCRDCHARIPWRYPAVELATGLWFWITVAALMSNYSRAHEFGGAFGGTDLSAVVGSAGLAILGFLLIGLMVMDWETGLLPNGFTLVGVAIAFLIVCIQAALLGPNEDQLILSNNHIQLTSPGSVVDNGNVFLTGPEHLVLGRIAAICGAALILLTIRWLYKALRQREGMGLGDVKLLAMIAAFLGFWPAVLSLFLGAFLASLYAAVLLLRGKAGRTTRLAFGSFLAIGGMIAALFGGRLIDMYAALLR
jgi:leader peptidase (prepilin peptidase)/N-methyltransferase